MPWRFIFIFHDVGAFASHSQFVQANQVLRDGNTNHPHTYPTNLNPKRFMETYGSSPAASSSHATYRALLH